MKFFYLILISICLSTTTNWSQNRPQNNNQSANYLNRSWRYVANNMPSEWYGSEEAKQVAENILITQKNIGGWAKNKPYHHTLSATEKEEYLNTKDKVGGTFDNGSTITELRFLAKVYTRLKDERYKQAFIKGIHYILISQYSNGGWPQYYPTKEAEEEVRLDHTAPYSMHITYNDNAMVNTMEFLKDIFLDEEDFTALKINHHLKQKAETAFNKGVECILNTQIVVNNKPTVWCAQHHETTLAPANARSYELASFSGSESVGIVLLLMNIEHPSKKIINAIEGAVNWFETHKVEGIKIERVTLSDGTRDRIVVEDKDAPTLWGRFYDLETEKPYFASRDGIKKNTIAEISYERRNGYSWYTSAPENVLKAYPDWKKKLNTHK
ncbi:pectate lyase [Mariniflexile soesokkakense]|uniref:Pectate lyase n=1 Tax=Mariniflexile soesokkakense TaxID=1343160 RepID=A0ABV0A7Z2_9FLAO